MTRCVCSTIKTNRIGIVVNKNDVVLYRFALDCPVHGVVSDRTQPIEEITHGPVQSQKKPSGR